MTRDSTHTDGASNVPLCVCVCVCEREREREREILLPLKKKGTEKKLLYNSDCLIVRVCVCVCVCVCGGGGGCNTKTRDLTVSSIQDFSWESL